MSITEILTSAFPSISKPQLPTLKHLVASSLAPLALTFTLTCPLPSLSVPLPTSRPPSFPLSTPYTQSQNLQLGLDDNGKIRACPSINPACVSTNSQSASYGFPWEIPDDKSDNAVQKLREAIQKTQRNVKFNVDEETPYGHYLQVEVDGGFGRDVMEFLVKNNVVTYRSMAKKVTYIYPFTTALGDSKVQVEKLNKVSEAVGWYAPNFESMD